MVIGERFVSRSAAWLGQRLPRVDAAPDSVDWFYVGLVAGPFLLAAVLTGIDLVDHVRGVATQHLSVQPQRTIRGYAVFHSRADRNLEILGLVAAAYPAMLWIVVRLFTRARRQSSVTPQKPVDA